MVTSDKIDGAVEQIMASSQSDYITMMRTIVLESIAEAIGSNLLFGTESKQYVQGVMDKLNTAHCSLVPRIKNETYKAVYDLFSHGINADELYMGLDSASKERRQRTVKRIAASTADIIARDNLNMLESSKASYLEAVGHAVSLSHTAGLSRVDILDQTLAKLCKGIDVVNYQSGVRYSADAAIARHMRTQLQQAANRDTLDCMEKTGWDLVYIMPKPHPRPSHVPYECRIYSRTGQDKRYPPLADTRYGQADGIGGINCRHDIVPYTKGQAIPKQYEPPIGQDGKRLSRDEWYSAEQRQRLYERNIRKAKRDYDTYATASGSYCDGALHAKNRILTYQAKARTNARKYGLVRRYDRERCYGLSYQPRGKTKPKSAVMDFKTSDTILLTERAKQLYKQDGKKRGTEIKKYLQKATRTLERVLNRYKNLTAQGGEFVFKISLLEEYIEKEAKSLALKSNARAYQYESYYDALSKSCANVAARTVFYDNTRPVVIYFNRHYIDDAILKDLCSIRSETMQIANNQYKNVVTLHESGHILQNIIILKEYQQTKPKMTLNEYRYIAVEQHKKELEELIKTVDNGKINGHITRKCHPATHSDDELRRAGFEFFAECHLEMIGGKKGTRGRAMEEFLKRRGYL